MPTHGQITQTEKNKIKVVSSTLTYLYVNSPSIDEHAKGMVLERIVEPKSKLHVNQML